MPTESECICGDFRLAVYTFNYCNAHSAGLSRSVIHIHLVLSDGLVFNQLCAKTTYNDCSLRLRLPVGGIFSEGHQQKNQCDDGSHRVFLETKKRYPPVFREGVIISLRVAQGESLQPATDTIPQKQSPESQEEVVSSHE